MAGGVISGRPLNQFNISVESGGDHDPYLALPNQDNQKARLAKGGLGQLDDVADRNKPHYEYRDPVRQEPERAGSFPVRTEKLSSFAERRYVELEPAERDEIDRIVSGLCDDPSINNKTVFAFAVPPVILRLYRDERFHVVFEVPHNEAIRIHGIGRAGSEVEFGQKKTPPRR